MKTKTLLAWVLLPFLLPMILGSVLFGLGEKFGPLKWVFRLLALPFFILGVPSLFMPSLPTIGVGSVAQVDAPRSERFEYPLPNVPSHSSKLLN